MTSPTVSLPPAGIGSPDLVPTLPDRAGERRRRRLAMRTRLSPVQIAALLVATAAGAVVVGLLVYVVVLSTQHFETLTGHRVRTLSNYPYVYDDAALHAALRNTAEFIGITLAVALLLGLPLAWVVERTDLPGKTYIRSFAAMGMVVPGFFYGISFLLLFDDRSGIVNVFLQRHLGFHTGPIDVQTLAGMSVVQGLALAPLIFIMTSASLRALNPELEEAAHMSGAGRWRVLRRVSFPLAYPGILGACIFVVVVAMSAFDIPLFIGVKNHIQTFSTYIFYLFSASTSTELGTEYAATASMVVFALALLLSLWYSRVLGRERHFQVVTGRGYRPRQAPLGRWRYPVWAGVGLYMGGGLLLTILVMLWAAFHSSAEVLPSWSAITHGTLANFRTVFSSGVWPTVRPALWHTVVLTLLVPTLGLVVSLAFSLVVVRTNAVLRRIYDAVAFAPQAVPGVIFGFAAFAAALNLSKSNFYASLPWLVVVMTVVYVGFGTRVTNSAMVQLHPELEEAARMSGAGSFRATWKVMVPIIRPALVTAWLWMALLAFRELTLTIFLSQPKQITVPVVIFNQYTVNQNNLGVPAALAILMLAIVLPLIPFYWRSTKGS